MKLLNCIKLCLIWALMSCGQSQSEEPGPINHNQGLNHIQQNELLKVLQSHEKFYEVKYYCEKTGGVFSSSEPNCICPMNMQFVGQGRPGCYPFSTVTLTLDGQIRLLTRSDNNEAYPVDISRVQIDQGDESYPNYSVLWKPYVHFPKELDFYTVTTQEVQRILGFFDLSDEPNPLATFSDVHNPRIVDPNYRDQNKSLHTQIEDHIKRSFYFTEADFKILIDKGWNFVHYHPRKCLIHCELSKNISDSKMQLQWKKEVRGGQLFREWIEIRPKHKYYNQFIIPITKTSRIDSVIEVKVKQQHGNIITEANVFQNGRARTFRWNLLDNLQHKELEKERSLSENRENASHKILLCDSDILIETLSYEEKRKLALFESHQDESFYGMLRTYNDPVRQFQELINTNPNGVAHTQGYGHGSSLLKFADDHSVVPMALLPCLNMVDQWNLKASTKGVRVVNISAADEVHNLNACRQKTYTEQIQRYGHSFLWVMAADNIKEEVTPAKSTSCPQKALYFNKNVLIVSHPKMQYGAKLVDIILNSNLYGLAQSSSEATMIMSQIATDLFNDFPQANPKIMKKAIILGADFDEYSAYKSRAGGNLNLRRTRKIMSELIRNPNSTAQSLIRKYFNSWDDEEGKISHIKEYYPHF